MSLLCQAWWERGGEAGGLSTALPQYLQKRFLPEGRQLVSWGFLLFRSFLWIVEVSQGQQLLVLLSVGFLSSWTLLGCHGSDGQGGGSSMCPVWKTKRVFSLKTITKHNFCNLSLVPPFGQGQLILVHLSLHHPIVPGIALELPISPGTSGEALLDHPVSPGWHVRFHSMGFPLGGLGPCWPENSLTCWRWSFPALSRAGQCQVIPRSCGCPSPD